MSEIELYKKNGFYIKRNLLDKDICKDIISQLNEIKTDMKIPHTNIQFGYGNVINHSLATYITDNDYVKYFCETIYGKGYFYNSLYVHNKHKWVGPDVEWHQEVFNMKTFHPTNNSYTLDDIKNNFMQVYVALEDQNIENGGMKIIPYQDSILKHYDTTNTHLNHKRAVTPEELDRIYDKYGIINLNLKAGDVMFFNHLIPHSSPSNNSPFDRKAMVFLTYKNNEDFDENIRIKEKQYRKAFALNYLNTKLQVKLNTKMYECGKESKSIKTNDITIRENNLLTNEDTMEYLYKLKDFPVSLSCVDPDLKHNKKLDMIFEICKKTGIIQIKNAPSLQDIYISPHNSSYGNVWHNLFDKFAIILKKYIKNDTNLLEIGGGALLLASKLLMNDDKIKKYTVYEKNIMLNHSQDKRINIIDEYFLKNTIVNEKYDFYIHSHVLEHVWNPREFIESIGNNMSTNSYHCFIVPHLKETFSKKYTNALDFEHNFFIIEDYINVILHNNNFEIIEKEFYLDHSIIYITKKIENNNLILKTFPNLYEENKKIALDFYNYHIDLIEKLNKQIDNFDGELYLFGGTGFSIFLIMFGLKIDKIINILDNDTEKENKKVYGTNFIVKNPEIIKDKHNVAVIVKAASYQEEIETQLYQLNNKIIILK
tara:strand:+ start:2145 stop:4103 length:1959 start_codon:yes stop_codon:yes gene_type:complete